MNSDKVEYYTGLVKELCKLPKETEWVEFKLNAWNPEKIGEYISALSNAAAITKHPHAYIVWGIDDNDHKIIGTKVSSQDKVKGQELENYLLVSLEPKINFNFYELEIDSKKVVLLEIDATWKHPTRFKGKDFIRIGSNKYELRQHPEKERQLWRALDNTPFELNLAKENLTIEEVLEYIDYSSYFKLLNQPLPNGHDATIDYLEKDHLVIKNESGKWDITNLGAILFANDIYSFEKIQRKAVRIIKYNGNDRIKTEKEHVEQKGYANGFKDIISYINTIIPSNEIIGEAFRTNVPMYPEIAIRELVANALIHQDFSIHGTSSTIEIFNNRIEITNPGKPLLDVMRFLDSPPMSRNENLASLMRRIGICEERGSGIDKVVFQTEYYQLPAPIFSIVNEKFTKSTLFAHKNFKDMDKQDRIRACYLHACLKYVRGEFMTNSSLRERFKIESENSAIISRIIKDTISANLVKCYDISTGSKSRKYMPFWA